jgi:hypothetical protein
VHFPVAVPDPITFANPGPVAFFGNTPRMFVMVRLEVVHPKHMVAVIDEVDAIGHHLFSVVLSPLRVFDLDQPRVLLRRRHTPDALARCDFEGRPCEARGLAKRVRSQEMTKGKS